jgi:AraC-like DNA-binding protein
MPRVQAPERSSLTGSLPPLPRLAFGNAAAAVSRDLDAFTATQRSVMPAVTRYDPLSGRRAFQHRSATARIGDIRLVASASTPVAVAAGDSRETTLLVPFHGWSTSVIDGREHRWQAGACAMFVPGTGRTGTCSMRSMLAITVNPQRLQSTARGMLGPHGQGRLELCLQQARVIPLSASRSPALAILKQVLPLIDIGGRDEAGLRMLGIDDTLYRIVAMMLAPETLAPAFARGDTSPSAAAIARVTEYIVGHLDQPITLSDLERVSGLSARTLQVAFQRAYTCSPREWIRRRRLLVARDRLLKAAAGDTVATIARTCGFTRPASFAAAFTARFGESPSATLARARRG